MLSKEQYDGYTCCPLCLTPKECVVKSEKEQAKIARYGWSASLVGNSIPTLWKKDDELMLVNDPF